MLLSQLQADGLRRLSSRAFDLYVTMTYRRIEPISLIEFDLACTDAAGGHAPLAAYLSLDRLTTFLEQG